MSNTPNTTVIWWTGFCGNRTYKDALWVSNVLYVHIKLTDLAGIQNASNKDRIKRLHLPMDKSSVMVCGTLGQEGSDWNTLSVYRSSSFV